MLYTKRAPELATKHAEKRLPLGKDNLVVDEKDEVHMPPFVKFEYGRKRRPSLSSRVSAPRAAPLWRNPIGACPISRATWSRATTAAPMYAGVEFTEENDEDVVDSKYVKVTYEARLHARSGGIRCMCDGVMDVVFDYRHFCRGRPVQPNFPSVLGG
ncbi:hypothetical protein [Streptomyces sp. NPDC001250]|uniref:hypothetical protein n=1 Tax=Streptomyces sp. NPDC001250 TaxID=3154382 RepID=UPI00332E1218